MIWRRERDSNPRNRFRFSGFQDHRHRPLGHPSASKLPKILRILPGNAEPTGSSVTGGSRRDPASFAHRPYCTARLPARSAGGVDDRSSRPDPPQVAGDKSPGDSSARMRIWPRTELVARRERPFRDRLSGRRSEERYLDGLVARADIEASFAHPMPEGRDVADRFSQTRCIHDRRCVSVFGRGRGGNSAAGVLAELGGQAGQGQAGPLHTRVQRERTAREYVQRQA